MQEIISKLGYTCEETENACAMLAKAWFDCTKIPYDTDRKGRKTMKVTYNGFTGELVKLEKKETGRYTVTPYGTEKHPVFGYDISIHDREKKATISFTGVKLGDVKFGGGAVTFDG